MKQLFLGILLLSYQLTLAQAEGTLKFYHTYENAHFETIVEYRIGGANSRPLVQLRVQNQSSKLKSLRFNDRPYLFNQLNAIISVMEGDDIPEYYHSKLKVKFEAGIDVLGGGLDAIGCHVDAEYESPELWIVEDRWTTVQIQDERLLNCLRSKESGFWLEHGHIISYSEGMSSLRFDGLRIVDDTVGINLSKFRSVLEKHLLEGGGNDGAREALDNYCGKTYSSESDIIEAKGIIQNALTGNISIEWMKEALLNCLDRLDEQQSRLNSPKEDFSASGQFNKYYELAVQAEQNGDYISAIRYYEEALKYQEHYGIRQRLPTLRQQANTQAIATGTATVVSGMMEIREDMYKDKLDGVYLSAITISSLSFNRTPGIYFSDDVFTGSIYATIDYTTWLDRTRNFGLHYGMDGRFDFDQKQEDDGIRYTTSSSNLAAYVGFKTLGGYLEVDYYLRGLYLEGEAYGIFEGQNDESTVGLGGPIHWDGGLRAALYLWNDNTFFVRGVFHWVDNTENSPIGFLDFMNETNIRTQSMGYRIEMGVTPFAFYFFHEVNTYYPYNNSLPIGMDIWGIGACFGAGF